MNPNLNSSGTLAACITKSASKQTYYTIRLLVDKERIANAYRAYGYFRWVDDVIDADGGSTSEKMAFFHRQELLLKACYRGEVPKDVCAAESLLFDLVASDPEKNSGLQMYLCHMMAVMCFDVLRRGRIVSQAELSAYTRHLAIAVTEALHYFIGHEDPAPHDETRYLAVTAAHIAHMLRDTIEDVRAGYFNIPQEYLQARGISPDDVSSRAYREWVCSRVGLARSYFKQSREAIARSKNLRRRLASYTYMARFEWILQTLERENYCLRPTYPERKGLRAGFWMGGRAVVSAVAPIGLRPKPVVR